MVTGDGSGDNEGVSLGACCASCQVTGHDKPLVLRQGHFSQEPLDQAWPLSGVFGSYPLWVRINHGGGVITTYGHNNRNLVTVGQVVHAGQPIAEVGNRGESIGPHLHFAVQVNGQFVNPIGFYAGKNIRLF